MKTSLKQQGMALFVSLIFLLLLTILGVASMKSAGLQEKMAGSAKLKNEAFQLAEGALRAGETFLADIGNAADLIDCDACEGDSCRVPTIPANITAATGACDVWKTAGPAFYRIQKLGTSTAAVNSTGTVMLYRVTAVADQGNARAALESIYAQAN